MSFFEDPDGQFIAIRGYASLFNIWSEPQPDDDDRRTMFRPWIYDAALASPSIGQCVLNCMHGDFSDQVYGRVSDGTLRVGTDRLGLWFEASPIPVNQSTAWLVSSIRNGKFRACSVAHDREILESETDEHRVVGIVPQLLDVSIGPEGGFTGPSAWLTSEWFYDLPHHVQRLASKFGTTSRTPMPFTDKPRQPRATYSKTNRPIAARAHQAPARLLQPVRAVRPQLGVSNVGGSDARPRLRGRVSPLDLDQELEIIARAAEQYGYERLKARRRAGHA